MATLPENPLAMYVCILRPKDLHTDIIHTLIYFPPQTNLSLLSRPSKSAKENFQPKVLRWGSLKTKLSCPSRPNFCPDPPFSNTKSPGQITSDPHLGALLFGSTLCPFVRDAPRQRDLRAVSCWVFFFPNLDECGFVD